MKRKLTARPRRSHWTVAVGGLLMGSSLLLQGCKDDNVLTGQPQWLGNSIYERLQEDGNYTTMLRLIDDLDQHEVLSHTGSKTLFAANDSAFQQWYGHNNWGVARYEQLTTAQKKLLLNNSMVNNAYLIELLSNVSGKPPMEGMCMRRETAVTIYDSVEVLSPAKMPNTAAWEKFKDAGKSIPIFKDGTAAPMIHFLPAYMKFNKITNQDLEILTNHQASDITEAWVNGKKVVEKDITCKNGYVQKVDGVIESSPNMAEIIRQHPQMSIWSGLLDRFSAPYYHAAGTREYNRLYNNEDSVYTLRYYSRRSVGGEANTKDPNGETVKTIPLKFDPGWNHYMYSNTMGYDLHYDAGAMIVPTDQAIRDWWENEGKELQTEYGMLDNVSDSTIAKLINVNMMESFSGSVPSKFRQVLNDAKEELGITMADVDSCFMGCNGVVYMVNRVFTPAEFSSVAYPALAHASTMNVIYWAIDQLNFLPYLLSMDSRYSLLLPTNDAMLWYVDPAGYGTIDRLTGMEAPSILQFYYDPTRDAEVRVQARRYNCTVKDRLRRLMDQLIIVGDVEDGHEYYKSKGGSLVRVFRSPDGRLAFAGGWQMEHNQKPLAVNADEIYPKTNGKSYQLNDQMPLGAQNTVYLTLQSNEAFSGFLGLLNHDGSELLSTRLSNSYNAGLTNQGSKNLKLLDNYNYTIYVPTNEAIKNLTDGGLLPTWEDYENAEAICQELNLPTDEAFVDSVRTVIKNTIVDFVRYHIQDHSVAVGMAPEEAGEYNPSYESMKRNPETGRFYPITVDHSNNQLTVTDVLGHTYPVKKTEGLYNRICREYWFKESDNGTTIFMASDAVVHQIDGALLYEELTPWKKKLNQTRRK